MNPEIALAWIELTQSPQDCQHRFHYLLATLLKTRLPDGSTHGILRKREDELRQSAHLILLRYLPGNSTLAAAVEDKDPRRIRDQIDRSINAAIRMACLRLRRSLCLNRLLICELPIVTCSHPALYRSLWNLSIDDQQAIVLMLLRRAPAWIPRNTVIMTTLMVEANISQAWMAQLLGISRQAVHRRLIPIRIYLRQAIKEVEFPFH
jgi:hypothetical protein